MQDQNKNIVTVPLIWAYSHDGAIASDIISLKNFSHADLFLMIGAVTKAAAVTVKKGVSVSSCATALAFTRFFKTGFVLDYDGASNDVVESAEAAFTGAGGGAGVVYKDLGSRIIGYEYNGTTFVDNETVTFTTSGRTVVANGIQKNEDILIPMVATSNTFNIEAVENRLYKIPISADMLGDGYDCICLNIADADTTLYAAWANLTPRYHAEIPQTALYD
jgi:hypothetical protein